MRMTNKIMQNNSLYNINNNKLMQDKLSTQMSTQKKITRPSDDPVIAIRALRLRTNVSELTQFYGKNAPDAESWLDVTGKALSTVAEVLTELSREANKADNKEKGVEDLQIILEQVKSLKDEFYSTANVDYAGRYVFTGYRTNTTLTFTETVEDQPKGYPRYEITEQTKIGAFDTINYTNTGGLDGINQNNYADQKYDGKTENDIVNGDIHRLRLSYDQLKDGAKPKIELVDGTKMEAVLDGNGNPVLDADGKQVMQEVPNVVQTIEGPNDLKEVSVNDNPYQQILDANEKGDSLRIFVPETGEILFSDAAYSQLEKDINGIKGTETEISVTYTKDEWQKGDLRPEHYFACKGTTLDAAGKEKPVNYNQEYLLGTKKKQAIEYDVGYNQKIQVNTTADEIFTHGLDRDVDDLEDALDNLAKINSSMADMEKVLQGFEEKGIGEGDKDYDDAKKQYDAVKKAYEYQRENVHNMFGKLITKAQDYLSDTNVAITDNGTRSQRLDLISNRLMDQKTTFQTLQSENEDADIAEVAIQLTSAELTYNSSLMATGKIMQTSLMNYI